MSVDSTPNATEMAAASTFSYAQAAKGQGATPAQNSTSNTNSQAEGAAPAPVADKTTEAATVPAEVTTSVKSSSRSTGSEKQETESVSVVDSEARSESVPEKRSESRRDDDSGRLDRPWRRNDKGTRSSSTTTRSADEHDSRRSRKGKKSKASDKQTGDGAASAADQEKKEEPEQPKIELAEAPIPSVNIWHQRKEQLSKVKPESTGSETTGSTQTAQDSTKPSPETNNTPAQTIDTKPAQKESGSKPERNGSRGNRLAGRENRDGKTETPPSVQDATLWPTPETAVTAVKEDKKKTTDKSERFEKDSQEDGTQGKPRQKKEWVTYDYVPSVNFETQLPQMRGSKPRGGSKATNNSRAGPSAQAGDKAAPTATTTSKAGESRDRPREATNGAPRSAPVQPSSKRASVDASRGEQRRPAPTASVEKGRDTAGPTNQADQQHPGREGRSDRGGRGSYRGRGGHHAVNSHPQHQHSASAMAAPFQPNGTMNSRAPGPYSPPPRQGGHGQMYMPPPPRGGRGGRNGSGNYHRMSMPNGSTRPPPVQTQFLAYDYPVAPMTAMPFTQPLPYWDNMVISMLRSQVEYYFSLENLCKDMFLRKHMDSQGFVPLMFIAAFKRMQDLSANTTLIRAVCEESPEIDYVVGEDEVERLRSRHSWQTFVLPMKDREELARNDGPAHFVWRSRHYHGYSPSNGDAYGVTSPQGFMNQPFPPEYHDGQGLNGVVNGVGNGYGGATQLSAEVPDFAPSHHVGESYGTAKLNPNAEAHAPSGANGYPAEAVNGMPNGDHSQDASQS